MRRPQKPEPSIEVFRSIAETGAIRSKIGRWFAANRDDFAKMLKDYRPRWEALVEKFIEEKLIEVPEAFWSEDPAIRNPARKKTVDAVRQIWQRAKRGKPQARLNASDPAASPSPKSEPKPPTPRTSSSPPVPAPVPMPDDEDDAVFDEPMNKFSGRRPVDRAKPKG